MSIQKQKLKRIASQIHKQLSTLNWLWVEKRKYSKRINYQIAELFSLISYHPTISAKELANIFDQSYIRLLIQNKKYFCMQDLCRYLGVSEKHADISLSSATLTKHKDQPSKLDKKCNKKQVDIEDRNQLEDIMHKEICAIQNIRNILKLLPSQDLFNQIDFFNNGYIDSDSLTEFVKHYNPINQIQQTKKIGQSIKMQKVNQNQIQLKDEHTLSMRCLQVIRYLKGSSTAQKIFYVDFISILQQKNQNMENLNNPQNSYCPNSGVVPNNSLVLSRSIGHIARVSEIEALNSIVRRGKNTPINHNSNRNEAKSINTANFTCSNESNLLKAEFDHDKVQSIDFTQEDVERIGKLVNGKKPNNKSYEQKICSNHWRNAKYLDKLKLQTNISNFKQNNQRHIKQLSNHQSYRKDPYIVRQSQQLFKNSFYPLKQIQKQQINVSQILYQFRYLAVIYERHKKEVQTFINQNIYFTLVDGFNVIDFADKGYVTYKDLKQFFFQTQITINQNKVINFFNILAKQRIVGEQKIIKNQPQRVIYYHNFVLKTFKIKQLSDLYRNFQKRKPLFVQQWPQQQKKNYCRFFRNIVTIFNDLMVAKQNLKKMLKIPACSQQQALTQCKQTKQKNIQNIRQRMQQIFEQSQIHYQKLVEILGNNCKILISKLYQDEIILEPQTFEKFLNKII